MTHWLTGVWKRLIIYKESQSINKLSLTNLVAGRMTFHYPVRHIAIKSMQPQRAGHPPQMASCPIPSPHGIPVIEPLCRHCNQTPCPYTFVHPFNPWHGAAQACVRGGCLWWQCHVTGRLTADPSADSAVRESETSTCTSEINFC